MDLNISKSDYCMYVQCPKMLWLKRNNIDLFDSSVINESSAANGNMVGQLATQLFDNCVTVPFDENVTNMINDTKKLIESNAHNIAEASFEYDGLFCSVDILSISGNNVEIYEVKSSAHISEIYKDDISFQAYILTQLGYNVTSAYILYINKHYLRLEELNLSELFIFFDATDIVKENFKSVQSRVLSIKKQLACSEAPYTDIGVYCSSPHPCGFYKHCSKHLPHPNVFDIMGMKKDTKFNLYYNGVVSFEDLYKSNTKLNKNQLLQLDCEYNNRQPIIDKAKIKDFLNTLSYPIYHLDFESYQPVVPMFKDSFPYTQVAFQYSLHIQKDNNSLEHKEFLAEAGTDPRRKLALQLVADIPQDVCVLAYNMSFEKNIISKLAKMFPDLSDHLMNIHDNVKDLMVPFQKKYYYSKEMQGSYSIKYVLPALFPNHQSLDYHSLDGIHNGGEAMDAFSTLHLKSEEEQKAIRENLLAYCKLDTLAMVKILEKLRELTL